ncbi:MAG: hypothetical protein ABTQ32_05360 [Myxococcaceae bacterium]
MTSPLESLDAFLESPESQRDLTRVVRLLVNGARSLVLCFGDERAPELAVTLARTFPATNVHTLLIESNPTRVTPLSRKAETITLPDRSTLDALRSCLRQDPDVIALDRLDASSGRMVCEAMFTGHLMIVGTTAASVDEAVALLSSEEGLRPTVKSSIDCALRLSNGRLRDVTSKRGEVVRECVVDRSLLPVSEPSTPAAPVFAPPISSRVATVSPRRAFLPVTGASANRSAIATTTALRPTASWPACRSCQQPLVHVLTLDTAELPLPAGGGLIQLFLCSHGCDTSTETAPGVLLERLEGELVHVEGPTADVLAPGPIADWLQFDEDPEGSLRCDKLGGWPSFEQEPEWPVDDDGARFELLFQFAERPLLEGGRAAGWDFEAASFVPAVRPRPVLDPNSPRPVLDPNSPRHFNSLLTGDAVACLFHSPPRGRLAFRW